jgi:hypothetical protein
VILPPIEELLERSGFVLSSLGRRAKCAYCSGRSITVGFNDETWHCFRCQAKGGRITLAKALGIYKPPPKSADPDKMAVYVESVRAGRAAHAARSLQKAFFAWRDRERRKASQELCDLGVRAARAAAYLAAVPEEEACWEMLAAYYHAEARLSARIDYLEGVQGSIWLETVPSAAEVVEEWRKKAS